MDNNIKYVTQQDWEEDGALGRQAGNYSMPNKIMTGEDNVDNEFVLKPEKTLNFD